MNFNRILNINMRNYFAVLMFNLLTLSLFSQQTDSFQLNTKKFAEEIFRECPEYLTEAHLEIYSKELARVSIIEMSQTEMPEIRMLSNFGLKNKCNSSLMAIFSLESFNPLKYFFDFYSDANQYIRVDNTNYVILISGTKK